MVEKPRRSRWPLILVVVLLAVAAGGIWKKQGTRSPEPVQAVPAIPVPASPAEQEFRAADANNDGYLSQDEMRSRFPYLGKEFQRVDRDGDGRVSPTEYFQARKLMMERRFSK